MGEPVFDMRINMLKSWVFILFLLISYFIVENIIGIISVHQWPGDQISIPGRVTPKTQKMVFGAFLLKLDPYFIMPSVKWSNPRKEVAFSLTPQCSSYWKKAFSYSWLWSANLHTYISQQFYFTYVIETLHGLKYFPTCVYVYNLSYTNFILATTRFHVWQIELHYHWDIEQLIC